MNKAKVMDFQNISKYMGAQKFPAAEKFALEAIKKYPREFYPNNVLGAIYGAAGDWQKSKTFFAKAVKFSPKNIDGLRNLGNAERNLGNLVLAQKHLTKALSLKADFPAGWCSLGLVYGDKHNDQKAVECFLKALKLKPDFEEAAINLFIRLDRENDIEALKMNLDKFGKVAPNSFVCSLFNGVIKAREGHNQEAKDFLESVSFDVRKSNDILSLELFRLNTLSKVHDKLGNFDTAYSLFEKANELNFRQQGNEKYSAKRYQASVLAGLDYCQPGFSKTWQKYNVSQSEPVFLVGFPRSGTTLLETFLGGHSEIALADERPLVRALVEKLGTAKTGSMASLDMVTEKSSRDARKAFETQFKKYCARAAVQIDKLPLNLVHVAEIMRVFPKAKFILQIRDPADSVFSCFMQTFQINDAMATLGSAKSAAETYDLVFKLWQAQITELAPQVFTCHYEALIDQPEKTLRGLIEFLGVPWESQILDHQSSAEKRTIVRTPSYSQVVQPLYTSSIQRWRNYAHLMPEALGILEPWRKHFGYSD